MDLAGWEEVEWREVLAIAFWGVMLLAATTVAIGMARNKKE
jgi:hypothetical protein